MFALLEGVVCACALLPRVPELILEHVSSASRNQERVKLSWRWLVHVCAQLDCMLPHTLSTGSPAPWTAINMYQVRAMAAGIAGVAVSAVNHFDYAKACNSPPGEGNNSKLMGAKSCGGLDN